MKEQKTTPHKDKSSLKRTIFIILSIIILALVVKTINFVILSNNPFFDNPIMDELYHHQLATRIAEGEIFNHTPYYRAPLYPYLLALVYKITGVSILAGRLFSLLCGVLIVLLIYLIARKIWNEWVGVISATIAVFYPMLLYFDSLLLVTNTTILFYLCGLYFSARALKNESPLNWGISGVFFGLGVITRPSVIPFLVIIWLLLFFRFKLDWGKRLKCVFSFIIPILLIIAIPTAINTIKGDDVVIIAWNGGLNFYLGNNSGANGWSATSPRMDTSWWGGYRDSVILAEEETGQDLKPSGVSGFWYSEGFEFIKSEPWRWTKLMFKKTVLLVGNEEINNNQSIRGMRKFSPLLRMTFPNFALILALGILGIVLMGLINARCEERLLFLYLLFYGLTTILFFVNARYRMPLVPVLIIFSGYSVYHLVDIVRERKYKTIILSIILVGLLFSVSLVDFYGVSKIMHDNSFEHFNLGVAYFKRGEYKKAIDEYELALQTRGNDYHIYNSIGVAYMELGEYSRALEVFKTSLKIKPNTDALNQVAVIYIYKQDFAHARKVLNKALEIEPDDSEVLMYMGIVEMFEENYPEAIEFLEHSLKTQPRLSHLNSINYNLGISYLMIEEFRTAREYFQKVPPGFEARDEYLETIDELTD